MTPADLKLTLLNHAGFEVVNSSATIKQVRLLGRVPAENTKLWMELIKGLLQVTQPLWSLDVSKHYFLRGDKLIYGWRLILQSSTEDALPAALEALVAEIVTLRTPAAYFDDQEIPLHASTFRHSGPNGKGARDIGYRTESGPRRS